MDDKVTLTIQDEEARNEYVCKTCVFAVDAGETADTYIKGNLLDVMIITTRLVEHVYEAIDSDMFKYAFLGLIMAKLDIHISKGELYDIFKRESGATIIDDDDVLLEAAKKAGLWRD